MNSKKNKFIIFITKILRGIILVIMLFLVTILSYFITKIYYKNHSSNSKIDKLIKDLVTEVEIDDISKSLIFCENNETGKIEKILIEICNRNTSNLDYITIPMETKITLTNNFYKKLYNIDPNIPQIILVSELDKYFNKKDIYEYTVAIIQDLIDIKINYYTVINSDYYNNVFETTNMTYEIINADDYIYEDYGSLENIDTTYKVDVISQSYLESIANVSIDDIITEAYRHINSNLSLRRKLKNSDLYKQVNLDFIHYYSIYGNMNNNNFLVSKNETNALIYKILNNIPYNNIQIDNINDIYESSKECNIKILNASKVDGLAANFREILTQDGYNITSIGNYNDEVLEHTKILVKQDNKGYDLLKYFKNASVYNDETLQDVDICIILGFEDSDTN